MKNKCYSKVLGIFGAFMLAGLIAFALAGCGSSSSGDPTSPPGNPVKNVSVGAQTGTLTAGTSGSVTFPITTVSIVNGTYSASLANQPTGIVAPYPFNITINNNTGTLSLTGLGSTVAGTYTNLTLSLDGVTSAPFTLTISS